VSRSYTSGHRTTKAFWNILSDHGLRVGCVGWWITYPAETINGVMVSQTNTRDDPGDPGGRPLLKGAVLEGVEGQVHPPELQSRVMQLLDEVEGSLDALSQEIFGLPLHPPTEFERLMLEQTRWSLRADATYLRVAKELLERRERFDLLAVYLGGTDVVGHRFWRYARPQEFSKPPAPEQIEDFGGAIDAYYAYADRELGELFEAAPSGTLVVVVSDHGMHAHNTEVDFQADNPPRLRTSGHHRDAPPGVIIAARYRGPAAGPTQVELGALPTLGSVLDVTPTLLHLLGLPLGDDMDGGVMQGLGLPARPLRGAASVPTHDTPEWLAARASRMREALGEQERLEQLRSLGYID
jgi:hypothetical protein